MAENYRYPRENIKAGIDYLQIQVIKTEFGTPRNTRTLTGVPVTQQVTVNRGQKGKAYPAQLTTNTGTRETTQLLRQGGFAKNKAQNVISTIILPMPSNISDSNQVTYSDDSLDAVTAEVAGFARGVMSESFDKNLIGALGTRAQEFLNQVGAQGGSIKDIYLGQLAASAAQIAGVGNITLNQILARGENQILNPNMELLFNGPTIRNFRFSFKMTPRDEKESADVKNIIRTFKKNMAPKTTSENSQFFLGAPNIFELSYVQTDKDTGRPTLHSFLHRFKQCALTDVTINYTGENIYATYADGTPVSIIMDLTFKELEPIYSSDYNGVGGVGY
jgi:hypothetical protein